MVAAAGTLRAEIAAQHPGFGPGEVAKSAQIAVTSGAVFHGVLLVLCALLVWQLGSGRRWVLRLTVVSQLLSVLFSALSWSSTPMFHPVIPVIGACQVAVVVLLCAARDFYRTPAAQP
jgi:hypothetical protein